MYYIKMSKCRIFCGQNGERFYIEAVMHLNYDDIIISLDFTHEKMGYPFLYGFVAINKDTVSVTNIIDAFNKADNDYNNKNNTDSYSFNMILKYDYDGIQLILYNIKNNTVPLILNIIECNKQKYYNCFIETIRQII